MKGFAEQIFCFYFVNGVLEIMLTGENTEALSVIADVGFFFR